MRHATAFTLGALAVAVAVSGCRMHIPPRYDNKPVAAASAPIAPAKERAR